VPNNIPFHHDNVQHREHYHEISWILLSTHEIGDPHEGLAGHALQCLSMIVHQAIHKFQYMQSLCLWTYLKILEPLQDATSRISHTVPKHMLESLRPSGITVRDFQHHFTLTHALQVIVAISLLNLGSPCRLCRPAIAPPSSIRSQRNWHKTCIC
jgi:hypothetical protein